MIAQTIGGNIDYVVLLAYFVGIMAFGMYFSRYTTTTQEFFFGGQRFSWWLIAFCNSADSVAKRGSRVAAELKVYARRSSSSI